MDLPLSKSLAIKVCKFMKTNFGELIEAAFEDTPFDLDIACAIACQETAIYWAKRIDTDSVQNILEGCVFDASGDAANTSRKAFPKNTPVFREAYGDELTDMLIEEANKTRALRNMGPKDWVYKGYGIFQYDLQHIVSDESFFSEKKWYSFDECLAKLKSELMEKYNATNDFWKAIKAYNGSGKKAEEYKNNVKQFYEYSKEAVID